MYPATATYAHPHYALVERCKTGERKAQYELYRLYAKGMFSVAMRIVNHQTEAEDVLQDAFVDAFQKLPEFRQESSFGAWFKQIVVNKALNQLRQRKVQWLDIDTVVEDISWQTTNDDPDIHYDVARIQRGIQQLPDGYRTVLSLYLLEGYDHEEIAEILGVAESTTRTQYMRAKKKLMEILSLSV